MTAHRPAISEKGWPLLAALAALAALTLGCQRRDDGQDSARRPPGAAVFPVEIASVEARAIDYGIQSVGTLLAMEEVQVTSRVSGVVEKVRFIEGARVQKGAVLAEIEPERWRIAVASAKAALDKARAATIEARLAFQRREALGKSSPGLISAEEVELYGGKFKTALAEEALAKAALDLAELNLRDAYVRAPLDGIIERRSVQTGLYAQPGTVLATMIRGEPLLLETEVSAEEALHISEGMKLFFSTGSAGDLTARVIHVGQAASPRSRRVRVLAEVDASGRGQRPGDFVKVRIPVGDRPAAPAIAQLAIRPSEKGFLVYSLADDTVRERVVTLGLRTADGFVEIRDGLEVGEVIVIRGNEPLFDGARVRVVPSDEAAGAGTPADRGEVDDGGAGRAGQAT